MSLVALGEQTAIGARTRVLFSRLLNDREYWELLHCDSVGEILKFLKETTGYADELADLPGETHRSELETRLEGIPFLEARSFYLSVTGPRRAWLDAWLDLYEAETLKRILRKIFSGHGKAALIENRFLHVPGSRLPQKNLLAADSFDHMLDALKDTPWFRTLREPLDSARQKGGTLFPAEMAMDTRALTELIKASRALSHSGQNSLADLFGTVADLLNLSWTIRGIQYFQMGFEEMVNRLLPLRHRIAFDTLRRLGRCRNLEALWELLGETPYADIFGPHPIVDSMTLEKRIRRHLRKKALSVYRTGTPSFSTVGAYLFLHKQEIDDLKMIVEDVRYDYNRRDGALFLARPLLTGGETPWHS